MLVCLILSHMKRICLLFLLTLLFMTASAAVTVGIDGVYYALDVEQNCATVVKHPLRYAGDVVIPEQVEYDNVTYDVKAIAAEAFSGCSSLVSVSIGNGVTSMGNRAFAYSSVVSVTIGDGMEAISQFAFYLCTSLTNVTIGNGVLSIGTSAFHGCTSLSYVIIGSSVASIGESAFYDCSSLTDVYCLAESIPSTEDTSFDSRYTNLTLHVYGVAYNTYFNTVPWSNFSGISSIHDGEVVKCAKPVINCAGGKLSFSSDTEGVEFKSFIEIDGSGAYSGAQINNPKSYTVSVFAVKKGCYRSETATKTFMFPDPILFGDLNDDGEVNVRDHVKLSDIILQR